MNKEIIDNFYNYTKLISKHTISTEELLEWYRKKNTHHIFLFSKAGFWVLEKFPDEDNMVVYRNGKMTLKITVDRAHEIANGSPIYPEDLIKSRENE